MKIQNILLSFLITLNLHAQPGLPDPTFGTSGVALGPFSSQENVNYYVTQQSDGKLISTGFQVVNGKENMFVLRYNTDGTFDANFGVNGVVYDSAGIGNNDAYTVRVQTDGKILVAGAFEVASTIRDIFLKRYDSTGVIDPSFGQNGTVTTDFLNNSDEAPLDMKIQPDGKIVICGFTDNGSDVDAMLIRYNSDGTLDSTFGNAGKVSKDIGGTDQGLISMAIQPDGRILVAGVTQDISAISDVLVMRYKPNGILDSSFNSTGIYTYDYSQDEDEGYSLALQPDGKIIVSGLTISINGDEDDLIIRLDSAGHSDPTFNNSGMVIKDFNGDDNGINNVMIQNDGKIVTAGYQYGSTIDISLARYNTDGSIDASYGTMGHIKHSIGIEDNYLFSALIQTDDKIVVTGSYTDSGLENVYTSRYQNDSLQTFIDKINNKELQLFPQPATTILKLINFREDSKYSISDSNGRIVCDNKKVASNIDIGRLEPGVYFIRLTSLDNEIVKRFVKIKN